MIIIIVLVIQIVKLNCEELSILLHNQFLKSKKNLNIEDISKIYVNRGPGSFGIRNSLSTVKAIYTTKKIDYYCFSFMILSKKKILIMKIFTYLCNGLKLKKFD